MVVCVTGASGYIASWLVKFLHQRMIRKRPRLQLFKANLLEEGSFDGILEGCEDVFHTASPFYHDVKDPQVELLDPALKETLNVLNSCTKVPSIKPVVLTSSIAAVAYNGKPRTLDVVVDESWFPDPQLCRETKAWYVLSKTLAKEAAWKFVNETGINMVTINPAMVIGPLMQLRLNTSAATILNVIKGALTFPNMTFGWVNVKDVAEDHIKVFEGSSASGRYCLVESVTITQKLSKSWGSFTLLSLVRKIECSCADDKSFVPKYQVSKEKAKSLGIDYIPLHQGIKETGDSLKEKGFVCF